MSDNGPTQPEGEDTSPEQVSIVATQSFEWSGPLPPPQILEEYSQLIPNAPTRFMSILESQVENRLRMERAEARLDTYGLLAAFILAAAIIVGGIYLMSAGYTLSVPDTTGQGYQLLRSTW